MGNVAEGQARFQEASFEGGDGKTRVMFLPGETLLLGGPKDLPIPDQAGRAVVIIG
jgi:hypothetical protein